MIVTDLYERVLIDPLRQGADELLVVSGYATAAMAFRHISEAKTIRDNIRVGLIVGMCPVDGLTVGNHRGLCKLVEQDFPGIFECSYLVKRPPAHSKVYIWLREDRPLSAYVGSANYTQTAFGENQREALTMAPAEDARRYYQELCNETIYCTHQDAEAFVTVFNEDLYRRRRELIRTATEEMDAVSPNVVGLRSVRVSFVTRTGELGTHSGLNWGQREGREPNQAYINLRAEVYKSDFFPPKAIQFTVLTDDGKVFICSRAQDNDKAIHTPHNNSLLGEYFRNRLSVPLGTYLLREHLERYGRTDVVFYKIDDETYYMDFAV